MMQATTMLSIEPSDVSQFTNGSERLIISF